jgi:Ca2+-binding EF-hand superfamily protein
MSDLEFSVFQKKLPTDRSAESQKKRSELFVAFDPNGNGFLSLAEIDKGARDILRMDELFDCKPVLMRAFQAARKSDPPSAANHQGDYVTKRTFRLLLWYLKEYFNLWKLFVGADESGDRRVSKEEFFAILPQLVERNLVTKGEAGNAEGLFAEADLDGGGMLLFEEFSSWALARGAKLVDGDE